MSHDGTNDLVSKVEDRKSKQFAQGHRANKWLDPSVSGSEPV